MRSRSSEPTYKKRVHALFGAASQDTNSTNSTTGALLCNSIGCPGGYTPIAEAWLVECGGGTCQVSQCCQASCSIHPCPSGSVLVVDASARECPDSGCTDRLCCDVCECLHMLRFVYTNLPSVFVASGSVTDGCCVQLPKHSTLTWQHYTDHYCRYS